MTGRNRFLTLAAVILLAACSDDGLSTGPALDRTIGPPAYSIDYSSVNTAHNSGSSSSLNITAPTVNVGDVLVAQVIVRRLNGPGQSSSHVICPPAGWTSIRRTNNRRDTETSDVSQETFVFVARTSAASATQQWRFRYRTCSGSTVSKAASGAIIRFTGVDGTNPIDAHDGNAGATTSPFATPSVTTTADGARVLRLVGVARTTVVSFPGITTLYSISSSSGYGRTAAGGQFSQSTAGSTGTGSFTFGSQGAGSWVGQTIALRAASAASPDDSKTLLRDTFSRIATEGWGAADVGGPWFAGATGRPNFRVDGSRGIIAVPNDAAHNAVTKDIASYGLNVAGISSFSVDRAPDFGLHTFQVYARRNDRVGDGDNYYRYRVRLKRSGEMDVRIEKVVNGAPEVGLTELIKIPTTFTPGAKYWIRWEAIGTSPATTVRMRVWNDGQPEPTWQASAIVNEPALDVSGSAGYRFKAPSDQVSWPVQLFVDDLLYREILH